MNNATYWRPDLAQLATHYENNKTVDYIARKVMPFKKLSIEQGSFRSAEEGAYFNQPNMMMSRTGYPNSFSFTDSTTNYNMAPYGGAVDFSNLQLSQAERLGYRNKADLIAQSTQWLSGKAQLDYEIAFTTFMQASGNYAAGFTVDINGTSVKWDSVSTSDPLKDVVTGKKLLWGTATDMIIGKEMFYTLAQHPKITGSSTVTGKKRYEIDPKVTTEYLQNYFAVQTVWVAGGIYNTTPNTPGTMTKGYIWGSDYVWLGVLDKTPGFQPNAETFASALALSVPEIPDSDFIAKETLDNRAGGVGMHYFDIVFYMQILARMQKLGVLLYNAHTV